MWKSCGESVTIYRMPCWVTEMGKKNTKSCTEQKTQSEEDGSSASTPLIAHDRLRLPNYALWSIHHGPINHSSNTRCAHKHLCCSPNWRWAQKGQVEESHTFSISALMSRLDLDLRGAVGHRHEEGDAQPQSLQQDDYQPLGPIQDHILDGVPPVMLSHTNRVKIYCKNKKGYFTEIYCIVLLLVLIILYRNYSIA